MMSALVTQPRQIASSPPAPAAAPYGLGFALFLVANATLFVRPAEIFPALLGWQIYLALALLCLAVSFPILFELLSPASLERRPIVVCVLALLLAVFLSHLSQGRVLEALDLGWDFVKIVLYFFLLVGLVTTRSRLRVFLFFLILFTTAMATLAILQYHGRITLVNLNPIKDTTRDANLGKDVRFVRLVGTGLFHDPNEFSIPMVVAILLSLYWLTDRHIGLARFALVLPMLVMGYALALTQSRGGLLALLIGLLVFLRTRFGTMLTVGLACTLFPALLLVFGGRQTDLEAGGGTAMERVELWSDALMQFRQAPLFGIGRNEFVKVAGLVAHNSFMHAFAELGFFGGLFYIGAFALALYEMYRLGKYRAHIVDPELHRLQPYLFGAVAAMVAGMMSLTLCYYVVPTYTLLGLASSYRSMARTEPALPVVRTDVRLLVRFAQVSVIFLICMYIVVRLARF
jgi:O-antigen ligase